jgi:hypothetical protein
VTISNTTAAAAPVSATNQTIEITNTHVSRVMSGAYAHKLTCTLRNTDFSTIPTTGRHWRRSPAGVFWLAGGTWVGLAGLAARVSARTP